MSDHAHYGGGAGDASTGNPRAAEILLLERLAVAVESIAESLKTSTQSPAREQGYHSSKDTQAIAVMLSLHARGETPTLRRIATEMGYRSHRALDRLRHFRKAWDQWQIMQTVTSGSGRSITSFFHEADAQDHDDE